MNMRLDALLVVLGVLLCLMLLRPVGMRSTAQARRVQVNNHLRFMIHRAVEYRDQAGRYPRSLDELLTGRHGTGENVFEEPFPNTDPWGHPYIYEFVGGKPYAICLGQDGAPGGWFQRADAAMTVVNDEPVEVDPPVTAAGRQ